MLGAFRETPLQNSYAQSATPILFKRVPYSFRFKSVTAPKLLEATRLAYLANTPDV